MKKIIVAALAVLMMASPVVADVKPSCDMINKVAKTMNLPVQADAVTTLDSLHCSNKVTTTQYTIHAKFLVDKMRGRDLQEVGSKHHCPTDAHQLTADYGFTTIFEYYDDRGNFIGDVVCLPNK